MTKLDIPQGSLASFQAITFKFFKRWTKIIFKFLFFFLYSFSLFSQPSPTQKIIQKYALRRPVLVIWKDFQTQQNSIWGDIHLLNEKFLPGSTFKLIAAQIYQEKKMKELYLCRGHQKINGKNLFCWKSEGHGWLSLSSALEQSCNLFFVQLTQKIAVSDWIEKLKFYFPSQRNRQLYSRIEFAKSMIGDNPRIRLSPQEMFDFWEKYLQGIQKNSDQEILQALKQIQEEGTLKRLRYSILGKTGTSDSGLKSFKTDAWILGAYPSEHPRYLFLVFMRNAHAFKEPVDLLNKILEELR